MSYQEYAQLGRNARERDKSRERGVGGYQPSPPPRLRTDRPYTGSMASFSVPRRGTGTSSPTNHSTTSSTSSASLSPSNSASQKAGNLTPTSQWGGGDGLGHLNKDFGLGSGGTGAEKKPDLVEVEMPWRPFYLQRKILAGFIAALVGLVICLEALLGESQRSEGFSLGSSSSTTARPAGASYIFRLAPTGLLTLMAVLWARVEYQAKMAAPWIRLAKGTPAKAEETLLLDYVGMARPLAVLKAVRNRDWVVAAATVVMLFLGVGVVGSAGLMYMSLVDMPGQSVPVTLTTAFGSDGLGAGADTLAFYTMLGLQQEDLAFPEGVAAGFAYQSFTADVPPGSMVEATVDGFSAGLDCEVANLTLAGVQNASDGQVFNTSFSGGSGCVVSMPIVGNGMIQPTTTNQTLYFGRFGQGGCGGSGNATAQRIVVVFGTETINPRPIPTTAASGNVVVNGTIPRSAALLCKPTYNITRIDVAKRDDVVVSIEPGAETTAERELENVEPWSLADAFFSSFRNELADSYANSTPWFYQPASVNTDPIIYLALDFAFRTTGAALALESLLDPNTLQDMAGDYFEQYVPLLASRALMQPVSEADTATAEITGERLVVSPMITQFVVTHLIVGIFLVVAMIMMVPKKGFLPRNPGTIMDTAALIANSRDLLQKLRGLGGEDMRVLRQRLAGSSFYTGVEAYERADSSGKGYFKMFGGHTIASDVPSVSADPEKRFPYPTLLHPIPRLVALLITIGFIVGLDFTLQSSNKNGGFDDVSDPESRHILWTVLPAAILGHVGMYFVSAGFAIRLLAPYAALVRGSTFEQSAGLNLVDRSPPGVLYHALRSKNLAVGGATMAAVLSGLLITFGATLFTAATVPTQAACQLVTRDFFSLQNTTIGGDGSCPGCQNGTVLASLVLNGNVSDPPFTHGDLVFPSLEVDDVPDGLRELPDDVVVSGVISGFRSALACKSFDANQIAVNLSLSNLAGTGNPMQISLPAIAGAGDNSVTLNTGYTLDDLQTQKPQLDPDAFFGAGTYKPLTTENGTQARWIWVWGQLRDAGTNKTTVKSIAALSCTESVVQLNVAVRFLGPDLDIDPRNPPFADEATAVPIPVALNNLDYTDLATNLPSIPSSLLLDPFFITLTSSKNAIPLSDLSTTDNATLTKLSDAITRQHRLIRAQIINTSNRIPLSQTTNSTGIPFPAKLTVSSLASGAARRVVQDTITTRILQALLACILVSSTASWLSLPKPNILPHRHFGGSIAAVVALLADGNIFGLLGRGAEWQDTEQMGLGLGMLTGRM
ncbi:hypothetical protein QBC47DRAFT_436826 [Echria macrotheca]|uniref:Uncharacterized protein n=1 Tax=Echria macrotheca TaxID=438768 RepID=A0AAJ0BJP4_9PEZI|nr:hypothetical protein QBC47DRAFT_436826 [Echria macrotheca]